MKMILREILQCLFWYEVMVCLLEYVIYPSAKTFMDGPSFFDLDSTREGLDFVVFTACTIPVRRLYFNYGTYFFLNFVSV